MVDQEKKTFNTSFSVVIIINKNSICEKSAKVGHTVILQMFSSSHFVDQLLENFILPSIINQPTLRKRRFSMEHYQKNDFELRQQSYTPNFVSFYGINFASPLDEDDVGEILCYFPFSGVNFSNFWVLKISESSVGNSSMYFFTKIDLIQNPYNTNNVPRQEIEIDF